VATLVAERGAIAAPTKRRAAVATRSIDVDGPRVDVTGLGPHSAVVARSVPMAPPLPMTRGASFVPAEATADELEEAGPFGGLDSGSIRPIAGAAGRAEPGVDPAWDYYMLLMPPLKDVLTRGFDLPHALYPYQAEGVSFLARRKSALLADDMGLGKTVQTIVAMRTLLGTGHITRALVVCPAGLKTNWKAEFDRWAPEIAVAVVQGASEQRRVQWNGPAHVLIANYELMRNDLELMPSRPLDLIVLDEAQRIKNAETSTSKAIKAIPRKASWCLTGTPIENGLSDLASIVEFLDADVAVAEDCEPEAARAQLGSFVLRREKTTVLTELPPKTAHTVRMELTQSQQEAYQLAEEAGTVYLQNLGETVTLQHVLALLTRLKQICNYDPATGESAKLEYLRDSLDVIVQRGEKALVFSQYKQTLDFLAEHLSAHDPLMYHGGMTRAQKDDVVQTFKSDESRPLLLISLQAGGVGLNLQEASYVYHYDRWWNPAIERQAEDRAYRMGQTRPVMVHRLVMTGTIEERVDKILEDKETLLTRFNEGESPDRPDASLSDGDYFGLLGLDPALATTRAAAS
jgi:SNF2 family DNA or RNA helicase